MLIGDRNTFAVEFNYELSPNIQKHVFGRMCVWAQSCRLGDMAGPVCMLDVPESILREFVRRLDSLDDHALADISDRDAFDLLESATHGCDPSNPVVDIDAFDKFDFLTNAGESFDGTISFIIGSGDYLRLLFTDEKRVFHATRVGHSTFIQTVTEFLKWMDERRQGSVRPPSSS